VPVPNPFVYGEIVPVEAFLDREAERAQLVHDLLSGQKVFLVAPRRYGKSSLVAVVLDEVQAQGARTVSLTVTQYATYRAFLESFAEACLRAADLGAKLRDLVRGLFSLRPRITYEAGAAGEPGLRLSFEPSRSVKDDHRLAREVFGLPAVLADRTAHPWVVALDEFQKITDFDGSLVEDALRAAVQTQRRVGYVFSGSEPSLMAQMLRPRRPFYKAGPLLALGKIPEPGFVSAIVDRFGQSRIRMGESLARDLVQRARNVPYDVQRLAHELWDDAVRAEVREIEPEQGHDAVTQDLIHCPLETVHRIHHELERRVEELLGRFRVEVLDQLGGVFDVGKQDGHLLALPLQGAPGGENSLGEMVRCV
jgi:uncharacterized protein